MVYRFLLSGKWLALTALLVLVVPLSAVAADWQYHRWESRKALNAAVLSHSSIPVAPIGEVLEPGVPLPSEDEWRRVSATGRFLPEQSRLLRRQVVNGQTGFVVMTPLLTVDGRVVVVARGFMPLAKAGTAPSPPAPTAGPVTIVGRLRPPPAGDQPVRPDDIPANQVNRIDPTAIAAEAGAPGYDAVLERTDPDDPAGLVTLPIPPLDEGPHLSYVGQWGLIGLASIVIWVILVRREAQHRREAARATPS